MQILTAQPFPTYLAWSFTHVLEGTFKRNRAEFMHHDYPVLAPLPANGTRQTPMEGSHLSGPFIYFVVDHSGVVQYVGKSKELHVLKRWIRPGNGGLLSITGRIPPAKGDVCSTLPPDCNLGAGHFTCGLRRCPSCVP